MARYSLFSILKNGLFGNQGWQEAWGQPKPKKAYDVIIIGGGGHGLATAYYLAKNHNITNVAVLEKGWLGGGNAGRNTTIVRSNYFIEGNTAFYEKSLQLWEGLSQELNYNVMFSQRGHLNLFFTPGQKDAIDDRVILALIGCIAVITSVRFGWQQVSNARNGLHLRRQMRHYRRLVAQRASLWCSLSGFSSFVSLTGGIPAQIYLLPLGLPRQLFVATMAWYFLFINLFKLPFFLDLNLLNRASLSISFVMVVFVPIGVFIGRWLNKNMSDKLFYYIAYSCLFLLGCQLLYRYFAGSV